MNTTTIDVSNELQLDQAIATVDDATSGAYVIQFTGTITEGTDTGQGTPADLYALNLQSGVIVTIDGDDHALDGAGVYRGLFVYAGDVNISDLTITDAAAMGGDGGGDGGGGAGLGGGLFVASSGTVELNNVILDDAAIGGDGGSSLDGGGGGGLGGAGGSAAAGVGGGGGVGVGADATMTNGTTGGAGIILGAAGGGGGDYHRLPDNGGPDGGAGYSDQGSGGGGVGGEDATFLEGGAGGFGGGGGADGGFDGTAGPGGFGGGGGGGGETAPNLSDYGVGGDGGFGGGGGGGASSVGLGGFGAGAGAADGGGGGLGAGGDIFVEDGGSLTIGAGTLGTGTVVAGSAGGMAGNGAAYGAGVFIDGTQAVTFAPGNDQTLSVSGVIADENGSNPDDPSGTAGAAGLIVGSGASNGTVDLTATNTFTGGITLESGILVLGAPGAAGTGTITFGPGDPPFLDFTIADAPTNTITGFGDGDTIDITDLITTATTATVGPGGALAIPYTDDGGGTLGLQFSSGFAGGTFDLTSDGIAGTDIAFALCFCKGTLIRTTSGDVPVECLGIGDAVMTWNGEKQRITWIGVGKVLATRGRRNAATPVIVRKGALADNVPNADVSVTKGHSFLVNDVLIPVEYLVNHRSILWDDRAQEVTIYHVELATHDVLIANGAPAESYRDDGNRWLFQNANSGWDQPPKPACAPVLTGGPTVDAVWRQLLDRAGGSTRLPLTQDAGLVLAVDGARVAPTVLRDDMAVFILERRPGEVRLVSRSAVPLELGVARDARELGVAIRRLAARKGSRPRVIEAEDARLTDGFYAFEADLGIRWTNGDAALPAYLFAGLKGEIEVAIHLGGTTSYPTEGDLLRAV